MKEKIDPQTLRLFPYVIFALIFSIMLSMLSPLIKLIKADYVGDVTMYQMNATLYMLCYFIIYLAIVGILSCLYHMSLISKWFGVACNLTGGYIISMAVVFIMKWVSTLRGIPESFELISFFVSLIPTLLLMMIIVYVLHGAAVTYMEMEKKKKSKSCLTVEVYWIAAFVIQILLDIIIHIDHESNRVTLFYEIIVIIIYLYSLVVMTWMYIKIKEFCYDYYIYSHNQGLML